MCSTSFNRNGNSRFTFILRWCVGMKGLLYGSFVKSLANITLGKTLLLFRINVILQTTKATV